MTDGGIRQCVSLPQSVCECLQGSFGVYTAGSLRKTEVSGEGIHGIKTLVFLLTSVGAPPPWHAAGQRPGNSRLSRVQDTRKLSKLIWSPGKFCFQDPGKSP